MVISREEIKASPDTSVDLIRSRGMELIVIIGPCHDVDVFLSAGSSYTEAQVTQHKDAPVLEGNRVVCGD
jgi:hypothetical protein